MNIYPDGHKKLAVKNIRKSFDDLLVIEDVSLDLYGGEFVSLLGLSGSGKSTVFNIISGLLMPDGGEIIIEGEDYTGRTGRVSYMYQKDLLMPWKTIIDNVAIPLILKGEKRKEAMEKAGEYFPMFGLSGFEKKYPHQLSGGMKKRAAFLRTYMFSKDIMLLDEPFGGLDAINRTRIHYWLMEVLEKLNSSVFLITHDIDEAIFLSDRIYILSDKPANVKTCVRVKLERPRNKDTFAQRGFYTLKKEILDILDGL